MNYKEIVEKCKGPHCYHRDGVLLTSNPPKYRLHCCNCGHMSYAEAASRPPIWGEHGPFYRKDHH